MAMYLQVVACVTGFLSPRTRCLIATSIDEASGMRDRVEVYNLPSTLFPSLHEPYLDARRV
jgi:hypothetical protein